MHAYYTSPPLHGSNEGGQGGAKFSGRLIIMGAPNHCWGRQMSAGGAEKSQQFHKCFLQHSKFPSEKSQVGTWGRQICFLPRAPSNLVTSLRLCHVYSLCFVFCGGKKDIRNAVTVAAVRCSIHGESQ